MLPTLRCCLGLISLGTALWDSRNTLRVTREADIAFWLHILAAGLIVHPLFSAIGGQCGMLDICVPCLDCWSRGNSLAGCPHPQGERPPISVWGVLSGYMLVTS